MTTMVIDKELNYKAFSDIGALVELCVCKTKVSSFVRSMLDDE